MPLFILKPTDLFLFVFYHKFLQLIRASKLSFFNVISRVVLSSQVKFIYKAHLHTKDDPKCCAAETEN